jgi:CubicO group peptidase (beta-lactamase class C family)
VRFKGRCRVGPTQTGYGPIRILDGKIDATTGETGMNRRDVLMTAGAAMIATPASAKGGWNKSKLDQSARLMESWIVDGRVQGAAILATQGARTFARNFGTAKGTDPIFLLASITKPMAAAAVMTLVDGGELSLDDAAAKFFPSFTGEGRETITLRNLLTHTGGLPDMLADDEMLREHQAPLTAFRDGALKAPLKFKPNTSYSYSSMGILLASEIAEKITGKPIAEIVEERIFKPLRMTRTSFGLRGRDRSATVPSQPAPALTEAGKLRPHPETGHRRTDGHQPVAARREGQRPGLRPAAGGWHRHHRPAHLRPQRLHRHAELG